jgi:protease-4
MEELKENAKDQLVDQIVMQYQADRRWTRWKRGGLAAMFLLSLVTILWGYVEKVGHLPTFGAHIAVVSIKGDMEDGANASADRVIPALRNAFESESAKLVILEVDSGGGSPVEAERIYTELDRLKKTHHKPVYAVINTIGASAAFMVAMHADKVYSGRYSLVGSIGAKSSRFDLHDLAARLDVRQDTYASGPLKDMFNPLAKPTAAEKAKAQAMVDAMARSFVADVKAQRGSRLKTDQFASGEVWTGEEALALGLVDQLGTIDQLAAEQRLKLSYLGPAARPSIFASFEGAISTGVESAVRGLARQTIEVR